MTGPTAPCINPCRGCSTPERLRSLPPTVAPASRNTHVLLTQPPAAPVVLLPEPLTWLEMGKARIWAWDRPQGHISVLP